MSHEPVPLLLKRGGDAFIVEHAGDSVTVDSTASSPPGSTLEASQKGEVGGASIRVKVRSCRRAHLPDGREGFRIEGRFISLTRADRELLFGSQVETDLASRSET